MKELFFDFQDLYYSYFVFPLNKSILRTHGIAVKAAGDLLFLNCHNSIIHMPLTMLLPFEHKHRVKIDILSTNNEQYIYLR